MFDIGRPAEFGAVLYGCGCCGSPNLTVIDAAYVVAANPKTVRELLADRDHPRFIKREDWTTIWKIADEE